MFRHLRVCKNDAWFPPRVKSSRLSLVRQGRREYVNSVEYDLAAIFPAAVGRHTDSMREELTAEMKKKGVRRPTTNREV